MLLMSHLLHEAELDVKNYAGRGRCFPPRLKAEEYRITSSEISQNNPSHLAKAEFNSVL